MPFEKQADTREVRSDKRAHLPSREPRQDQDSPAQIVLHGLVRLIEGQRRFADEFGLDTDRVLTATAEAFRADDTERIVKKWMSGGKDGASHLRQLMDDLIAHQIALVAALDGVGSEMVAQFSPEKLEQESPGLLGMHPFRWRSYCAAHRELGENSFLRLQKLVLPGFVKGYLRAREIDKDI